MLTDIVNSATPAPAATEKPPKQAQPNQIRPPTKPNMPKDKENSLLDGLASQWNNMSLSVDVENNSFAYAASDQDPNADAVSYYLLGTVRALEEFPPNLVKSALTFSWNPRYGMDMKPLAPNLYLFRFNHRIDINRVLREEPWRVKDYLVAIKEVPAGYVMPKEQLVEIPMWIQLHGLPPHWIREDLIRFIGGLIGPVREVDPTVRRERPMAAEYARVRVEVNSVSRLLRGTSITHSEVDVPVAFKYEKLFNFCYLCGTIDHVLENCVAALQPNFQISDCQYGDWLRGIPPRHKPWDSANWLPMKGSTSNPFTRPSMTIPPGFRALPQAAPPPALPAPIRPPALPLPCGPATASTILLPPANLVSPADPVEQINRTTYKKREPKKSGLVESPSMEEAEGPPGFGGKRRRADGSSSSTGDPQNML